MSAHLDPAAGPSPESPLKDDLQAFDGRPTWKVVRTLRDGTSITIRPIAAEDREDFRRAFGETSANTRYLRFFAVSNLSEKMLTYLTDVDQFDHIALVATMTSPDLKTERGIGVARVIRLEHGGDVAEAAITVVDAMQRRGVGLTLAREVEAAARARGIRTIRAEVLESNSAMRAILESTGAQPVATREGTGTLSYDIAIAAEPPSGTRIVSLLRGAAQTMAMSIRKLVPSDSE